MTRTLKQRKFWGSRASALAFILFAKGLIDNVDENRLVELYKAL